LCERQRRRCLLAEVVNAGMFAYRVLEQGAQRITFFYNRNVAAQLAAHDSAGPCKWDAVRGASSRHGLDLAVRFAKCSVADPTVRVFRRAAEDDLVEAIGQMARIDYFIPTASPPVDADHLAAQLAAYYERDSSDVIFVAHSQGNMILADAKHIIRGLNLQYQTPERCIAALSLASPIPSTDFGMDGRVLGMMMENDVLWMFGAINDMTPTTDDRTAQAAIDLAAESNVFKHYVKRFQWGQRIHEVNWNYLKYARSVDMVQRYLRELRDGCATP
jgi:hypothetical protein